MWTCSKCGEKSEDDLNSCPKCAAPRTIQKKFHSLEYLEILCIALIVLPGFIALVSRRSAHGSEVMVLIFSLVAVGVVGLISVKLCQRRKIKQAKAQRAAFEAAHRDDYVPAKDRRAH